MDSSTIADALILIFPIFRKNLYNKINLIKIISYLIKYFLIFRKDLFNLIYLVRICSLSHKGIVLYFSDFSERIFDNCRSLSVKIRQLSNYTHLTWETCRIFFIKEYKTKFPFYYYELKNNKHLSNISNILNRFVMDFPCYFFQPLAILLWDYKLQTNPICYVFYYLSISSKIKVYVIYTCPI